MRLRTTERNLAAFVAALLATVAIAAPAADAASPSWRPVKADRWQYQLNPASSGAGTAGGVTISPCGRPATGGPSCVKPTVYEIDLHGPDGRTPNAAAVQAVHGVGARAVCYVDAGTWERWRPDAAAYPASVKGADVEEWPGEKWLDVRDTAALLPIVEARVAQCAKAGFDAVEFDNVDGWANSTGFPLTAAHQLRHNRSIAAVARKHGLAVGLKNDLDQVKDLVGNFDFAVNEQCRQFDECGLLKPFLDAGKPVVQIEYSDRGARTGGFCAQANAAGRSAVLKQLSLKATPWTPCR